MRKRIKALAIIMSFVMALCSINFTAYAEELKTDAVPISYSSELSAPKVSISVIKSDEPKLKVKWEKVEGANKYYIYRRDTKTGSLKLIAKTSKLYYKDEAISVNKTYYYRVKACKVENGKVIKKSDSSATVKKAVVRFSEVQNLKATTVSESKIKLTWDKVKDATKYYIYYSSSKKGNYKYCGYTTGTTSTISDLNSGLSYYFKVRPVKVLDKTTYKGSYSEIVSAKTISKNGEFIVDFERISNKEAGLPTGSAMTCLAMLMNHYGVDVTPKELVPYFNCSTNFYYKNGVLWGPDPDYEFAGDPTSGKAYAFGCQNIVIDNAFNNYLKDNKISDVKNVYQKFSIYDFEKNKKFLKSGNIVIARMRTHRIDEYIEWKASKSHGVSLSLAQEYVIICGYTEDSYIVYNPFNGIFEKYNASNAEYGFIVSFLTIKN